MRIAELVQYGISELKAAGIPDCTSDVYLLAGHCLNKSRTQLLAFGQDQVPIERENRFKELLARRVKREPVAYILGEQEFWSLSFKVNSKVLIPRPETELLVEKALAATSGDSFPGEGKIIDLCCGSGVIAIILALELKREILAIDISAEALAVTKENCVLHGVGQLVELMQSDLLSEVITRGDKVSMVVSNPPYVTTHAVLHEVEPEVGVYEPHLALDGGDEGLDQIVRIRRQLSDMLVEGGHLFMEIGADQGTAVHAMFSEHVPGYRDFRKVEIISDYAGRDRILHAIIA
ncbi:peptide chain release factor N(5)-glutamine methyltransferase [Desulfosediminicola ganghwensis]|uniref:peptide chain release factor N(5)-glutamine methyltransferase n=1 Tax=Desulfosediminicola ganghwensis TaxID=2569540 RepID=UPI0010AC5004|nr:peptide chain release factor N(5)-glutamine methyltransferase [Desulfosediminicola ganghwensis]